MSSLVVKRVCERHPRKRAVMRFLDRHPRYKVRLRRSRNTRGGKFLKAGGLYVRSRAVKRVCERHPREKRCKGPPACGHAAVLNSEI